MSELPASTGPRIGFDATAAFTQGGGIGRYTRELLSAVLQTNERFHFSIFSAKPDRPLPVQPLQFDHDHVRFKQLPLSPRWLYRIWYRLRLPIPVQLFTGGVDLFHSPDFVLPPVAANIPTLLTVHDLSFVYYPETFTSSLVAYLNRVVPWSVKRATHVLADSVATKQDLMTLYETPEDKISVLYSGVNARFAPVRNADQLQTVRAKYALGEAPFILTVGTLQPRKNIQMLVQSFKPLAGESDIQLIVAGGKGWLYEQLLDGVQRAGLQERVQFIGFVEDADLPALYSAADVFAFPSIYEGFGLPILEAMACGTPVLASNSSSLPEVTGEAGVLIAPDDEAAWTHWLRRVREDEALREKLIARGRERTQDFSWEDSARQLHHIYSQMLSS